MTDRQSQIQMNRLTHNSHNNKDIQSLKENYKNMSGERKSDEKAFCKTEMQRKEMKSRKEN